jgi:tryptophan-rich sensory protein
MPISHSTAGSRPLWRSLAIFIAITVIAQGIGGLLSMNAGSAWYADLAKPPGNPPSWVFAPVWTALYLMMGIAAGLVYHRAGFEGAWRPLNAWVLQLALNVAWSGFFFAMQRPGAALAEIVLLWGAIVVTVIGFFHLAPVVGRAPALLMLPYLAWVSFALYLNAGIWWLNR